MEKLCSWSSQGGCAFNQSIGTSTYTSFIVVWIVITVTLPLDAFVQFELSHVRVVLDWIFRHRQSSSQLSPDQEESMTGELLNSNISMPGLLLRGAFLESMKPLDSAAVSEEVASILTVGADASLVPESMRKRLILSADDPSSVAERKRGGLVEAKLTEFGDAVDNVRVVKMAKLDEGQALRQKLVSARERAKAISEALQQMASPDQQNSYLLQQFVVECLAGYRKGLAQVFFDDLNMDASLRGFSFRFSVFSSLLLLAYLLFVTLYIFLFGLSIGSKATSLWLLDCFVTIGEDFLFFQPLKIFIKYLLVSQSVASLHVWHMLLRERSRSVLRRRTGFLQRARRSLVQRLNPACRASRLHPELAASRLLMGVSDTDMLVSERHMDESRPVLLMLFTIYMGALLAVLPDSIRDSVFESFGRQAVQVSIAILQLLYYIFVAVPVLIVFGIIGALVYVLWPRTVERRVAPLKRRSRDPPASHVIDVVERAVELPASHFQAGQSEPESQPMADAARPPEAVLNQKASAFSSAFSSRRLVERRNNQTTEASVVKLHLAAIRGEAEEIKQLVKAGLDVNSANENGETALMLSIRFGQLESTETLLDLGADVNVRDSRGNTALHYAAEAKLEYVIELLLSRGGDMAVKNLEGVSPGDMVGGKGNSSMAVNETSSSFLL